MADRTLAEKVVGDYEYMAPSKKSALFLAASAASARCSQNIEAAMPPDPNEVSGRYSPERGCHEVTGVDIIAKKKLGGQPSLFLCLLQAKQIYLLSAVATSTAQATVQLPTPLVRNLIGRTPSIVI